MDAAQAHRLVIDVLVADAAARSASFGDLISRLPGVPPDETVLALRRLAAAHLIDSGAAARLAPCVQPARTASENAEADGMLPPPHPLDYDWRFSASTARRLTAQCVQLSRPGDTIVLLGTPTVMGAAARAPQDRRWVLLEASPATTDALSQLTPGGVLRCDLSRDELPSLAAQVVVADPPWYAEHTRVFAWAAAQLTRSGATVLLAQPPVATRPGVLAERAAVLAFAQQAGLEPVAIRPGDLAYVSPPFERGALRASGLSQAVPLTWRRGDLIVMHRTASPVGAAPRPALNAGEAWQEVVLHGARIRFRMDQRDSGRPADPRLRRLVEGDVLPSVSRRDPLRPQVSVWTGGNRVFGCRSPRLLAAVAGTVSTGGCIVTAAEASIGRPPTRTEQARIGHAACQLRELADRETATRPSRQGRGDSIVAACERPVGGVGRPGSAAGRNEESPSATRSAS